MDQEEINKKMAEITALRNAANAIVNSLVGSGFRRERLSIVGNSIIFSSLVSPFVSLVIADDILTVKIHSRLIITETYDSLKNLAGEKGWIMRRA